MNDTFCETPLTPSSQRRMDEDRSVSRMQRLYPGKLRDLCQMHLAFILDFSDSKLEIMLEDSVTSCKRKLGLSMFKVKEKSSNQGLFGVPLSEGGVHLMMPLISFLRKPENLKKEGLFRKAGNGRKMKLLKEQLLTEGANIVIDPEMFGSHDVACVLKEFLRELPEPLLTYKHMEAHRQIRALGVHASLNEKDRYFHKKLSAVQYLMRLIPVPVQKMVRHLMKLLHKVSTEPETKMTAETLGTIFAPICFLNRKAAATDVCDIVGETEPTVAFMVENAKRLFEVPRELVVDVVNFWKEVEKCKAEENSENNNQSANKMTRWPSGPIVNTAVCYADRRASQNSDTASTTQAELASLFAHVQSLPDTPANLRLKRQIQKSTTPMSSDKAHHRSKSIGASIKKHLPSLGRSKNKYEASEFSVLSSGGSYRSVDCLGVSVMCYKSNSKVAVVHCGDLDLRTVRKPLVKKLDFTNIQPGADAPIMSDLLDSPASSRGRATYRESRPRHKRPFMHCDENIPECTPTKQERRARSSDYNIVSPNENILHLSALAPARNSKHKATCTLGNCKCSKSSANVNSPLFNASNDMRSKKDTSSTPLSPVSASAMCYANTHMDCISVAEKEIDFLPYHHNSSRIAMMEAPDKENSSPQPVIKYRKCNGPSTPIMKRAKLQLTLNGFETAI